MIMTTVEQANMLRTMCLRAAASVCARRAARFYAPNTYHVEPDDIIRREEAEACFSEILALIQTDEQVLANAIAMGQQEER